MFDTKFIFLLLALPLTYSIAEQTWNVSRMRNVQIQMFDGILLCADVHIPKPMSETELFPVVIFANSWAEPQQEYILDTIQLAEQGYLVLEYATRGWPPSKGLVNGAGPKDQKDTSSVISFLLDHGEWKPDPDQIALAGISYGAGLALLGAANDRRVKAAIAMSGWPNIENAFFRNGSPNLMYGSELVASGIVFGHLEPEILKVWREVLNGNEPAFHEWAVERSVQPLIKSLEDRGVPLLLSNNIEDGIFPAQDMLLFFEKYKGPKKMLVNQGIHASAEIGGLVDISLNYVWREVQAWLNQWLKGCPPKPHQELATFQLRSNLFVREKFHHWPSKRTSWLGYRFDPRGWKLHGALKPMDDPFPRPSEVNSDSISFGERTGISAGIPFLGDLLEAYVDKRVRSDLLFSSRSHAIWYYAPIARKTRFCGTPFVNLDVETNAPRWQIVVYLLSVNWRDQGTLLSHGTTSCWNCTVGKREIRQLEMRTLCEDVSDGIGLAISMFSELYEPANRDHRLRLTFHYSDNVFLKLPVVLTGGTLKESSDAASFLVM